MIGYESRYRQCIVYRDGQEEFLGTRPAVDTTAHYDDLFHVVAPGDRVDGLAHRYYQRPDLWWIICDYNGIANPLLPLVPGTTVRLPSPEHVFMQVLA